jgi:hypothetical protein
LKTDFSLKASSRVEVKHFSGRDGHRGSDHSDGNGEDDREQEQGRKENEESRLLEAIIKG